MSLVALRLGHTFDVLALGRAHAINLGIDYPRMVIVILVLVLSLQQGRTPPRRELPTPVASLLRIC